MLIRGRALAPEPAHGEYACMGAPRHPRAEREGAAGEDTLGNSLATHRRGVAHARATFACLISLS
jgi:hypothetical protein